jgi:hypothetical protein
VIAFQSREGILLKPLPPKFGNEVRCAPDPLLIITGHIASLSQLAQGQ